MTSPLVPHLPTNLSQFLYLYEIWFSFRPPPTYMISVFKYPVFFHGRLPLIKIMSNAALYFISPLVRHVERSRMYIPQTFLDRCCWSQVLCCWSQVLFFWIMSLCPSLSLNFFLKNQLCSRTTLLRLVSVLSSMLRWPCKYQREVSIESRKY